MTFLRFAFRTLRRDLRAGELHLLGLALLIAVASLVSVGFLTDRVAQSLDREANQLLGGDLLVKSDHPWSPAISRVAVARGLQVVTTTVFSSMALGPEGVQLAGVKAVEPGYPLRGSLRIAPGPNQPDRPAPGVPPPGEAWLDERLFAALSLKPGDQVGLGNIQLKATAQVTFESDRGANFFSVLPRILVNAADLPATGLIQEGSRVTWQLQIAGEPAAVAAFKDWLEGRLERGQGLESVENARPEVRAALDQAQRFLRLAALMAVVLAAVAIGLAARRFMRRHLDGCAVMRCLGARQAQVTRLLLLEFLIFGVIASSLGVVLGWAFQEALAGTLADLLDAPLPEPSWLPAAHGLAVGVALLLGFALPPLLRLAAVPTLRVLRREWGTVEPLTWLAWLLGAGVLAGLLLWIAGDLSLGLRVAAGFAAAVAAYAGVAWLSLRTLRPLRGGPRGAGWRFGLAALQRRQGATVIQVVALAVGLAALLLLTVIQADLLEKWRRSASPEAPNRFVINIQHDQRQAVMAFFQREVAPVPQLLPMIRGRLVAINGRPVGPESYTDERARRLAEREFNLSFSADLQAGNRIIAGSWHGASREPQFSVEQGIARTMEMEMGDRVVFEVAGRRVEAPITSVRELEWDSMRVNFFFVASPGLLDDSPASLITSFRLAPGQEDVGRRLIAAFPNLSVIDVSAMLAQVQAMMGKLIGIVRWVFGFALLAGVAVLWAALQATQDERAFELAMLRTLGGRNRQLRLALLTEFGVLGAVAGTLAGLGATALGWVLAEAVFKLEGYQPGGLALGLGAVAGACGVMAVGWLGARGLLRRPPLASLRGEG
jgi:putative ABC transport system permease protein